MIASLFSPRFSLIRQSLAVGCGLAFAAILPAASAQTIARSKAIPPQDTSLVVTERGADFRKWGKVVPWRTNEQGQVFFRTNSGFTELSPGLHHKVGTNWMESSDSIAITADGGAATNGVHKVKFAGNINTASAIQLTTPDGKLLKSHIIGLAYFDSSANTNVLIATLQDRIGHVVGRNQVIYTNAFTGVNADVRYTYKRGSFEQDVILRERPPTPGSLGLNPQTTTLQVWTEFVDPPKPRIAKRNGDADDRLDFGAMKMGPGQAFFAAGESNSVAVTKHWVTVGKRTFLQEEIPLKQVSAQLNSLPVRSANGTNGAQRIRFDGFPKQLPAAPKLAKQDSGGLKLAGSAPPPESELGFVMDYSIVNSSETDFTFQSDTTYLISGALQLYGVTTIEGGAVIKYAYSEWDPPSISVNDTFVCRTTPYHPAIFTSKDDDSVGETISGSSGTPGLVAFSTYLYLVNPGTISNMHFSYAWNGYGMSGADVQVWDCQFIKCSHPITTLPENTSMGLHNLLITMDDNINNSDNDCTCVAAAITGYATDIHLTVEHLTADLQSQDFIVHYGGWMPTPSAVIISLTNSIVISPHLEPRYRWGSATGSTVETNSTFYSSAAVSGLFQGAGGGGYYLANNSPHRNAGSTDIPAALLKELKNKTTYPPVDQGSLYFTLNATWNIAAPRDVDLPDRGYHYEPLDYLVNNVYIGNYSSLTLGKGVAIGISGNDAFHLYHAAHIAGEGTPDAMNRIIPTAAVQEQGATCLNVFDIFQTITDGLSLQFRFTDFGSFGRLDNFFSGPFESTRPFSTWKLKDCTLSSLGIWALPDAGGDLINIGLTNNVFARCWISMGRIHYFNTGSAVVMSLHNNLFWKGEADVDYDDYSGSSWPSWEANENVFDSTVLAFQVGGSYFTATKNGYINTTPLDFDSSPVTPTSFTYADGPLGPWYQDSTDFHDAGSTTADVSGLYHFTTTTDQMKEGTSPVDIGFHYVAVDQNGKPIDTTQGGSADYFVDVNGNGTYESSIDLANWYVGDLDGDDIPDGWEIRYFGHLWIGKYADPDGDGISNYDEYGYWAAYDLLHWDVDPTRPDTLFNPPPGDKTVGQGGSVDFSIANHTFGATPTSFQWQFNGGDLSDVTGHISGATTETLTLDNVSLSQAGNYTIVVHNSATSVVSPPAHLTVNPVQAPVNHLVTLTGSPVNHTFRSDTTYLVNSTVQLSGTTTIEGGTVIKFDPAHASSLVVNGSLVCKTTPYYPAILTILDDDSIGQFVDDGDYELPQAAENGVAYLDLTSSSSSVISYLRFRFADRAVTTPTSSGKLDVWDCQFAQCHYAVNPAQDAVVGFHNVLVAQCGTAVGGSVHFTKVEAEQLTAYVTTFWDAPSAPSLLCLTNSIILGTVTTGPTQNLLHVAINPTGTIFQTGDSGSYYLAQNSSYRAAGTANITAELLAELKQKTTYPPMSLPLYMDVPGKLTLTPQVARYTSGSPDMGYYYDALDYTVSTIKYFGSITVLPGTAIGLRRDPDFQYYYENAGGFDLFAGSSFVAQGLQERPIEIAHLQFVQEGPFYWNPGPGSLVNPGSVLFSPDYWLDDDPDNVLGAPVVSFRFCNFHLSATDYVMLTGFYEGGYLYGRTIFVPYFDGSYPWRGDSSVNFSLKDCNLHGGKINLGNPADIAPDGTAVPYDQQYPAGMIGWTNNLFERVAINLEPTYYGDMGFVNIDIPFDARNNLFRNCVLHLMPPTTTQGNWTFKDNFFDKTAFEQGQSLPLDHDYNGYWELTSQEIAYPDRQIVRLAANNSDGSSSTDAVHDQVLTSDPGYQPGPFGIYYYPTSSALFNAGSRTPADAGLYHYTTRQDQVKEGSEASGHKVNIGLHYIAAANGVAIDTDSDGIPDYVEDGNGNGIVDSNETNPGIADSGSDLDGDGLTALQEYVLGTSSTTVDSDNNGIADCDEDFDGDGIPNIVEIQLGTNPLKSNISVTVPQQPLTGNSQVTVSVAAGTPTIKQIEVYGNGVQLGWANDASSPVPIDTTMVPNGQADLFVRIQFEGFPQSTVFQTDPDGAEPDTCPPGTLIPSSAWQQIKAEFSNPAYVVNPISAMEDSPFGQDYVVPPGNYTLTIRDEQDEPVREFNLSSGDGTLHGQWDGLDSAGNPSSSGLFSIELNNPGGSIPVTIRQVISKQTGSVKRAGTYVTYGARPQSGIEQKVKMSADAIKEIHYNGWLLGLLPYDRLPLEVKKVRAYPNDETDVGEIEQTLVNPSAGPGLGGVGTWIAMGHGGPGVCFAGVDYYIKYPAKGQRISDALGNQILVVGGSQMTGFKHHYFYIKRFQCAQILGCNTSTDGIWARFLGSPPDMDQEKEFDGKSVFLGYKGSSYSGGTGKSNDFAATLAAYWGGIDFLEYPFILAVEDSLKRNPKVRKYEPEVFGFPRLKYRNGN